MADKKTNRQKSAWGDIEFAKFEMTDEIERSYEAWASHKAPDPLEALDFFLAASYKISLKYSDEYEQFSVSLTGGENAKHNANVCMVSYSESLPDAILLSLFKAEVFYDGQDWPTAAARRKRR